MPSSKPLRIRDALVTLVSQIQYNGEQAFQLVTGDPSTEFDQEPFALVFPGEMTSTQSENRQRDRTINFSLLIMLNMESEARTQDATYDYMYNLTDATVSYLEASDISSALNTIDNTLGVWMMETSRAVFVPAETKVGTALLCTIDIAITYSIDL